jgi:hypothetical protein
LRFCVHPVFGAGCVFGERIADSGNVADIYFIGDAKVRTILTDTLLDCEKVELPRAQRKALRSAHSEYRKLHKKKPSARIELRFSKLKNRRKETASVWCDDDWPARDAVNDSEECGPEPQTELENAI